MKQKSTKRSTTNKHPQVNTSSHSQTRRLSNSSTGAIDARKKSSHKAELGTGTSCFNSNISCFKANLILKSQKVIKRDLLRSSDQQPSLLNSHALQTPRIHHRSQQIHTVASSSTPPSSIHHRQSVRRRSLSADSHLNYTTNDPLGPWPDTNELIHPIKNFRNFKNPRICSPKYYGTLTENTTKFKFYSLSQTYMDEYRKQKGYSLGTHITLKMTPRLLPIQQSEDEQLSSEYIYSSGDDFTNDTTPDQTIASRNDLSSRQNVLLKSTNVFFDHTTIGPSVPVLAKIFNESHHINNLPTIALRNGHIRSTRHSNHHPTVAQQSQQPPIMTLPPLTASSYQYISGMNSMDKVYSNSIKPSIQNHSKFFLIDRRHKRKYVYTISSRDMNSSLFNKHRVSQRIQSDSGVCLVKDDLKLILLIKNRIYLTY